MLPITAKFRDKQSFHVTWAQTHTVACLCFARLAAGGDEKKAGVCPLFRIKEELILTGRC